MLLAKTYFPTHAENRMGHADDVVGARTAYLESRPSNLTYLLRNRYEWMNEYLDGCEDLIEIGAGSGLSREFIRNPRLKLTDYHPQPWIDEKVDALSMPYEAGSLDAVVCSHMIHHLANPTHFFREIDRVLRPGGYLVVHDTHTSFFLRVALRLMRHDGWSYEVDVFDESLVANNPADPWSANAAIPELLFRDHDVFHEHFPSLEIVHHRPCEFLIFLLSGGVTAKTFTINLPRPALKVVDALDRFLIWLAPSCFALSKEVVLRKRRG